MKRVAAAVLVLFVSCVAVYGQTGMKKKKPLPSEYGKVVMNEFSGPAGISPVVFDHWLHRKSFTCRLCHVDIGFGMTAGATKVRAADNAKGFYCGTCHNGKTRYEGGKIFASCSKEYTRDDYRRCLRCHALEKNAAREEEFARLAEKLPREPLGNGINWEMAEQQGLIKLVDHLEGVSPRTARFKSQQDFSITSKVEGMPDIIFSHTKHTAWSGCELCHPDIFMGIKKGSTRYTMIDLFQGRYCGVCHGSVAFPQSDCQRCHSKPVQ